jgi:hypothetical protein
MKQFPNQPVPPPGAPSPKFDIDALDPQLKASPIELKKWLDQRLPYLCGPHVEVFDPPCGQRGTILTIRGERFARARADNHVKIGGTDLPVLAASDTELRVLVTKNVDSGPLHVSVGGHIAKGPHDFKITGYPGTGEDGPPVFAAGVGQGQAGDVNPIGTLRVLIVVCQTTDRVPSSLPTVIQGLDDRWKNVRTFYDQASYGRTVVQYDIVNDAALLDGNFSDFVDLSGEQNIKSAQTGHVAAIAAQRAKDSGFNLDNYQMLCCVVYTNGAFVRAWGGVAQQTFYYDDGKPTTDPGHIHIDLTLAQAINLLWINESANWGRFAHEFGHNIVSAPTSTGDGTATLGEDVYGSDLVDPSAATAASFEMMANHDSHPIFTGYHLEKLGYYAAENIKTLTWDRNPHSEEVELVAHALAQDSASNRFHLLKVKVSDALTYYVEVRQRPGTTTQIFDEQIPIGAATNAGGVIVTRVIAGEMHNNQQTRFITLMHENEVQVSGDFVEDPARALRISVVSDSVQARPLVCRVKVEWAQTVVDDPSGAFDLKVEPWDTSYQSPDIWIDRTPLGSFDNPKDADGRPTGNGDKPWVNHVNQFTSRVHVSGAMGASNVKLTFYAVTPPGVGDNGNWAPIATTTIASIAKDGFVDASCNWVPVVGEHTCLRAFASAQLGEISGSNNGAQENVFEFQAAGSSPADPVFIRTAIRNPVDQPRAIHLSVRGVPRGWSAQIPNAWVWLDGNAERQIEILAWPTTDLNEYQFGRIKEGHCLGTAPLHLTGAVERNYLEKQEGVGTPPGSRFFLIGGTLNRVSVRRRASIQIEQDPSEKRKDKLGVKGSVTPAAAGQRVLVDALYPDGKTRRSVEVLTGEAGTFVACIDLNDETPGGGRASVAKFSGAPWAAPKPWAPKPHHPWPPQPPPPCRDGVYRLQAFIFHASELADAESNLAYLHR